MITNYDYSRTIVTAKVDIECDLRRNADYMMCTLFFPLDYCDFQRTIPMQEKNIGR